MASQGVHIVHRLLTARDWQDRPQLDAVCRWWRDGSVGVCALVGIGGAGKTAVADRLPGRYWFGGRCRRGRGR